MRVVRRPLIIDLNPLHFPITALVSILHRISGIVLVLGIPWILWCLEESLKSEVSFSLLQKSFKEPSYQFILFILVAALIFHWLAGIRHMLMDLHLAESKKGGKWGAIIVLILFLIFALIFAGILAGGYL